VGKGVDVDGVGEVTPGLDLLGDFLGVGRGKHAGDASVLEGIRQRTQNLGDGVRLANRREDARAEEGVAAESVEKRIFGTGDVGVDPLDI
jgi:hypothetical protein